MHVPGEALILPYVVLFHLFLTDQYSMVHLYLPNHEWPIDVIMRVSLRYRSTTSRHVTKSFIDTRFISPVSTVLPLSYPRRHALHHTNPLPRLPRLPALRPNLPLLPPLPRPRPSLLPPPPQDPLHYRMPPILDAQPPQLILRTLDPRIDMFPRQPRALRLDGGSHAPAQTRGYIRARHAPARY